MVVKNKIAYIQKVFTKALVLKRKAVKSLSLVWFFIQVAKELNETVSLKKMVQYKFLRLI